MKSNTRNKIIAWLKLIAGFAFIGIFCFLVLPLLKAVPAIDKMTESNRKNNIDAGSLFYTETSQFSEADNFFINANKEKKKENEDETNE
jgi:hypothetical protein